MEDYYSVWYMINPQKILGIITIKPFYVRVNIYSHPLLTYLPLKNVMK